MEFTLLFWGLIFAVGGLGLNAFVIIPLIFFIPVLIISLIQWKKRVNSLKRAGMNTMKTYMMMFGTGMVENV